MKDLILIAGPCVIENELLTMSIAEELVKITDKYNVRFVFKASFDKANRTHAFSFRGLGMDEGLKILDKVKHTFNIQVTTDIHLPDQAKPVSEICEVIQIPALLCRQTDLIVAAAKTKRIVNIKKGQFLAPLDLKQVANKIRFYTKNVWLTERGTFFGYGRLVNDFAGVKEMIGLGFPVIFDATHSVQTPNSMNGATGGNREMVEPLAKAAVAVGVDGLFFETHPDPDKSPSDGQNMVPLDQFQGLLVRLLKLREVL